MYGVLVVFPPYGKPTPKQLSTVTNQLLDIRWICSIYLFISDRQSGDIYST